MSDSLSNLVAQLQAEFALTPVVAAEIECYVVLPENLPDGIDTFWVPVNNAFQDANLPILRIEKERGDHQYEIITQVMTPERLAQTLTSIRAIIEKYAARMQFAVSFAAKPYADQPSSGLHIHLHLADGAGMNAYHKTEEWTSDVLCWSLGGLLASLTQNMPIFFPDAADYARLEDVDHVPKIFGWGVNNRYCALRIPADQDMYNKRIEHRVPCANADATLVMTAMLAGVLRGLRERIEPSAQEYGKQGKAPMQELMLALSTGVIASA